MSDSAPARSRGASAVRWVLRRQLPLVIGSLAIATLGPYLGSIPIRTLPDVIALAGGQPVAHGELEVLLGSHADSLAAAMVVLVVVGALSGGLGLLATRVGARLSARAVADLRLHVHERLMQRPPEVVRADANRIRTGILDQSRMVASFATNTLPSTLGVFVAVAIWGGTLWSALATARHGSSDHPGAAALIVLVVLAAMIATSTGLSILAGRRARQLQAEVIQAQGELTGLVGESVDDVTELQLNLAQRAQQARLERTLDRMARAEVRVASWSGFATSASGGLLLLAIPLAVLAWRALDVGAEQLTVVIPALMMLQRSVGGIGSLWTSYRLATPAIELIDAIIAPEPTIADSPQAVPLARGPGKIELANVTWSAGDRAVLRGVSLAIDPGECVALVGRGGSGKSTVLKLLVRALEPTAGRIALDGQDLATCSRSDLRRRIALLDQHPAFFARSVRENLVLDGAQVADAKILELADRFQAREVIDQLNGGLDHVLAARSGTLSGSERRRLALVRMLLREPDVLLLDELEAGLPQQMAKELFEAVRALGKGKTCVIVTHRPDLLRADRIALIHEGAVLATGTHEELDRSCEPYRTLLAEKKEHQA